MLPMTTGGGGMSSDSGSANAAEHRYFPRTSTDRPAKKPKRKVAKAPSSSASYMPPTSKYSGPSAMDMIMSAIPPPDVDYQAEAAKIYKPSMDFLNSQIGSTKKQARTADIALRNMYHGLTRDIGAQAKTINQQYGGSINQIKAATSQGQKSVKRTYDTAENEQAAMLKRLGIQAAAPDTLTPLTRDEAFFQSLIGSSGGANQQQLVQNRQASQDFNTAQRNIAGQTGAEARSDNQLVLQQLLADIGGRKADLSTTINQQAQSMQQSAAQQQLEAQKNAMAALNADRSYQLQSSNLDLAQGRFALDTSKFEASQVDAERNYKLALQKLAQQGSGASTKLSAPDSWGKASQLASQLYNGNQTAASNALQAVRDAIARNPDTVNTWKNPNDLVRAVLKRNPGANDVGQLTSLATFIYQQLFGR